jgi:hypothetical protein
MDWRKPRGSIAAPGSDRRRSPGSVALVVDTGSIASEAVRVVLA